MPDDQTLNFSDELEARFKARYSDEKERVDELLAKQPAPETSDLSQAPDANTGGSDADLAQLEELIIVKVKAAELNNLRVVGAVYTQGLAARLRKRGDSGKLKLLELVERFANQGVRGMLQCGPQRGGDFLDNQLRGAWAEDVVISLSASGDLIFLKFGPSMAAMPGAQDHASIVRTFREITLLEGKRPDLLVFEKAAWLEMPDSYHEAARSWPKRLLGDLDRKIIHLALAGIEVKTSLWHAQRRRIVNNIPLSVTVKDEEVSGLVRWSENTGLPLLFSQVLLDEIYFLNFSRMRRTIEKPEGNKYLYEAGDYRKEKNRKSGKYVHYFSLYERHKCASVRMPDKSEAHISILTDGSVVPYLKLLPALGDYIDKIAIRAEINYAAT